MGASVFQEISTIHGEGLALFNDNQLYVIPGGRTLDPPCENLDGRVTIIMPHPERTFLTQQMS